ncbi:MAG TPA: tryptophan 2,3-dioxygenase family protein, partial [Phycicoccus sp.]|nr:tryptophan 2,3-dioxygenase family protein [Phycicoccus sp.]
MSDNQRQLEDSITRDFSTDSENLSYGAYLDLARLLSSQHPRSTPVLHDEMLFIIQHQVAELWLKLLLHELHSARDLLSGDELAPALKRLARIKHVLKQLVEQWDVLATLTPSEYAQIRPFLATSSGFQSWQYRSVEFILGNKNADMIRVFAHDAGAQADLTALWEEPTVYDAFLRHLARNGYAVPASVLERDVREPYREHPELVPVIAGIYADPSTHWGAYEACEELVDI